MIEDFEKNEDETWAGPELDSTSKASITSQVDKVPVPTLIKSEIYADIYGSDHCPVSLEIRLPKLTE